MVFAAFVTPEKAAAKSGDYRTYYPNQYDTIWTAYKRGPDALAGAVFALGMNASTVRSVIERGIKTGSPQPSKRGGSEMKLTKPMEEYMEELIGDKATVTIKELQAKLAEKFDGIKLAVRL